VILTACTRTPLGLPVPPSQSKRSGFSLIEVLIALTIFLLSFVAIARLVDMGTERELESQFNTRATRLAQSKMSEIVSGSLGSLADLGNSSGDFDNDPEWSWKMTSEMQMQGTLGGQGGQGAQQGGASLYTVTVTVSRHFKGKQFQFVLTQMAIDPVWFGSPVAATSTTSTSSTTGAMYPSGFVSTGSTGGSSSGGSP
jgi:prepilin-type N-terminal cleavage/methylation domain-containing protein